MHYTQAPQLLLTGDPQTPGRASVPDLPASERLPYSKCNIPGIPTQPLAYGEASHLLQVLPQIGN